VRVCVFCGSSDGADERYAAAAVAMAEAIVAGGHTLVYGGAAVGTMGTLADMTLALGGEVVGVIPEGLWEREIAHPGLAELLTVRSLADRKLAMAERSDVFVALPGGYGTLDELFEMVTWTQLGIHAKPVGLLDVADFWTGLLSFLDTAVAAGFIRRQLLTVDTDPARLLASLSDLPC